MLIGIAVAIMLAALMVVLVSLIRRSVPPPRKPRRRDYTPRHIQARRILMARFKRVRRGLRFPTVQQKKEHRLFIKQLTKFLTQHQPRPTAL